MEFWGLYAASRLLFLLLPSNTYDCWEFLSWGAALVHQENPFDVFTAEAQGLLTLKYPPLFYLQATGMYGLFGPSFFAVKLGSLIYEGALLAVVHAFVKEVQKKREASTPRSTRGYLYVFAFNPVTIFMWLNTPYKVMAVFFQTGALLFYLRERWAACGAFTALGFLTEFYPVVVLLPIGCFLLRERQWKALATLAGTFLASTAIVALPFLLANPDNFLFTYLVHLSRYPQTQSLWRYIREISDSWTILSLGETISLSILGAVTLVFVGGFAVGTLVYYQRRKTLPRLHVLWVCLCFFLCLPVLFLTAYFRYYYWFLPLGVALLDPEMNPKWTRGAAYGTCAYLVPFVVYATIRFPGLAFADLTAISPSIDLPWWQAYTGIVGLLTIPLVGAWLVAGRGMHLEGVKLRHVSYIQALSIILGCFVAQFYVSVYISSAGFLLYFTIPVAIALGLEGMLISRIIEQQLVPRLLPVGGQF